MCEIDYLSDDDGNARFPRVFDWPNLHILAFELRKDECICLCYEKENVYLWDSLVILL